MHKMSYKRMLKAYIMSIQHLPPNDAAVLPFESCTEPLQTFTTPIQTRRHIKHKHLKDSHARYSKTLSILYLTIQMEDTASTSTKPYVMYIVLPWHRSGCRTVRPEDVRFPSLCCSVCGCGRACVCS